MKKKRRNPRPERSALDNARAALERAGEEYPPVPEEDNSEATEAANDSEQSATPAFATVDDAGTPENAENAEVELSANTADAEAEVSGSADSAETQIPDSADADDAEAEISGDTDAAETEAPESADAAETETPADTDELEAEVSGDTDGAEMETPADADDAEAQSFDTDDIETQVSENTEQTAAFVEADTAAEEVPDANPELSGDDADMRADEPELSEDEDAESDWNVEYEPFPEADSEDTDTERHTMETKEITLDYPKSPQADEMESGEAESGKKSEKREKKPRFKGFNPLERLKAAVQEYAGREKPDKESDDIPPSAASRDVAIRKRVMQISDEETRNYLLDRVLPQMTWYGRKSAQYQKMYYRLMVATIVLGALIPIFSLLAHPVVVALLGVSVTAINAYLALRKYHELWVSYSNVREDLLHTLYCYFNRAGVFAKKDSTQAELDVLLVDTCENAFSKENGGWAATMRKGS